MFASRFVSVPKSTESKVRQKFDEQPLLYEVNGSKNWTFLGKIAFIDLVIVLSTNFDLIFLDDLPSVSLRQFFSTIITIQK